MDINCDFGESFGAYTLAHNEAILPYVTSVNIACGFHAGDPMVMQKTVQQALKHQVNIGAHPGYPDLQGFGRRAMTLSAQEIYALMMYQMGALQGFVQVAGGTLHHVKPHGALYNQSANDETMANAIIAAILDFNPKLILYCLSGSKMAKLAKAQGLAVYEEVFADRNYNADGSLVSRQQHNAMIEDEAYMLQHVERLIKHSQVQTITNEILTVNAQTICIHGDGAHALAFAKEVYQLQQR
ncbi:UPF0271 protein [Lysinibacillus alkalisoli]|uniref:UPF0271 protein n=1 Tax=Lysinibacillus alkalisoli TaxID=1911548 RepID=A0A917D5R8_9BACI|nr:5-oxoprolinase subunit PxpA [Lysinibacillus alkalisoli]GGG09867.1 UPF0271 protein [Lysinibacillus alkalisoli]